MPYDAVFNANEVKPQQFGGGAHPIGNKFPFTITNTLVAPTNDGKNGKFVVELTSQAGSIKTNFNLFHENDMTRNIARAQFSLLCHAVGIFRVDFKNDGTALRGGVGLMDIGFQKGQEPSAEKPEGGYVEVKKIYDKNGNDPTQQSAPQSNASSGFTQQQPVNQPQTTQQQNGGFGQQVNTNQPDNNAAGGWNAGGSVQQVQQQAQPQQGGGWQANAGGLPQTAPWQK